MTASPTASRTSLESFGSRNQIPRLTKADALGSLIEKPASPEVDLSPDPVMDTDRTILHFGLDTHGMGTIFEQLFRRFNEENNEEVSEHFTPRDGVQSCRSWSSCPRLTKIEDGNYLL